MSQRRDWLFALALADPERATKLADKLIERAKSARGGRNAPLRNRAGRTRLDPHRRGPASKSWRSYGNLPREIDNDD